MLVPVEHSATTSASYSTVTGLPKMGAVITTGEAVVGATDAGARVGNVGDIVVGVALAVATRAATISIMVSLGTDKYRRLYQAIIMSIYVKDPPESAG
jgi:hypothetical protein